MWNFGEFWMNILEILDRQSWLWKFCILHKNTIFHKLFHQIFFFHLYNFFLNISTIVCISLNTIILFFLIFYANFAKLHLRFPKAKGKDNCLLSWINFAAWRCNYLCYTTGKLLFVWWIIIFKLYRENINVYLQNCYK